MINRTLSKRLARLETRLALEGEPLLIQIQFVSSDGTIKARPTIFSPGRRPQVSAMTFPKEINGSGRAHATSTKVAETT
jgi:hypothetical protein